MATTDAWGRDTSNPNYGVDLNAKSQSAITTIKSTLAKYKLESLFDTVWNNYTNDTVDYNNMDAVALSIRETDAYKTRFAGNEARRAKGLGDLSPATYIALEDSFRQTMKSNGMPAGMYDSPEDFAQLIGGDVGVDEFNDRIQSVRKIVQDSPPEVLKQMGELYGVTEGQLIAYYMDPGKATPILKEQERAARIGAAAKENANIQLSAITAGDLAKRGITDSQAYQGFSNINNLGELAQNMAGEKELSQQDFISSQFGFNSEAEKEVLKRKDRRLAEFQAGGSFTRTQGQTPGAIQLGVGAAQ
jgi:hypothetical protein